MYIWICILWTLNFESFMTIAIYNIYLTLFLFWYNLLFWLWFYDWRFIYPISIIQKPSSKILWFWLRFYDLWFCYSLLTWSKILILTTLIVTIFRFMVLFYVELAFFRIWVEDIGPWFFWITNCSVVWIGLNFCAEGCWGEFLESPCPKTEFPCFLRFKPAIFSIRPLGIGLNWPPLIDLMGLLLKVFSFLLMIMHPRFLDRN